LEASFRKNIIWDYFNRFGNTVFSLVTSTILARLLTPADFGLVGIAMAVNAIAGIFLNFGFVSAIIQAKELDNKNLSTVFFLNTGVAVAIYFLIFFFSNPIASFYKIDALSRILKVTSLAFIINGFNLVPVALMSREMRFKQIAVISLFASIISGSIGIIMALSGYGVWSIIVQQLTGYIVIMVSNFLVTKWFPILYFKLQSIKGMLKFGVYMFLSGMLDSIYTRIDIFLIAKVFSPVSLGLYTRAQSLDTTVRMLSSSSLLNVLFPTFAKIRDDKARLTLLYYQYFELISFLFCCVGGIFYIVSYQLFHVLFGNQWNVSAQYFQILVIVGFAYPLSSLSLSVVEARGNSRNFFVVEVIKKCLFLPTYFIAYYYGIVSFLLSYVVACFIGTFINVRFVKYELPINVWQTVLVLSRYFFTAACIISGIEYYNHLFPVEESVFRPGIEAIIFVVIYFVSHFGFKSRGYQYALGLIKK
jgi:teichuronic acid exporter